MNEKLHLRFSVLMSVYFKETVENLRLSLNSIFEQTILPDEIVLVKDGPVPAELDNLIDVYRAKYCHSFRVISLDKNVGLGQALNTGLNICKNDIVARMDTDDICYPERFEKQLRFLEQNNDISVVGTQIQEFNSIPCDLKRFRKLPYLSSEIEIFSKYRNPLNHPTVFFRKDHVLKAGSYQHMPLFEDYFLWARMLNHGFKIGNIDETLLHFRIGNDMVGRRNGYSYALKELAFLKAIRAIGFISSWQFFVSVCFKLPVRILPKKILELVYKFVLR